MTGFARHTLEVRPVGAAEEPCASRTEPGAASPPAPGCIGGGTRFSRDGAPIGQPAARSGPHHAVSAARSDRVSTAPSAAHAV
ncbi:hypothetical protein GCM10010211_48310 [Streptomyces albospinus]|uniref:Uncharacterized protein n=1 Tax=Streptomyces albospinus TaxID=285515 RepID=A0ABQ2VCW6_9ACTN|nr:hypothetical protein GCM10010211_48310 [Streptomyces albospinus]